MLAKIRKFSGTRDEGASAVEYGLLVAAIAALIVIVVFALGGVVQQVFDNTCTSIAAKTADPIDDDCPGNDVP